LENFTVNAVLSILNPKLHAPIIKSHTLNYKACPRCGTHRVRGLLPGRIRGDGFGCLDCRIISRGAFNTPPPSPLDPKTTLYTPHSTSETAPLHAGCPTILKCRVQCTVFFRQFQSREEPGQFKFARPNRLREKGMLLPDHISRCLQHTLTLTPRPLHQTFIPRILQAKPRAVYRGTSLIKQSLPP